MKKVWSVLLLAVLFASGCSQYSDSKINKNRVLSFSKVQQSFKQPGNAFRPQPFWVWHDKLDTSFISRDLQDFAEMGMGGGFMHPRYGLITEYLSDEWFDAVEYAVDFAKAHGMQTWIYDENSFPSGFGGGLVPAEMPESYNQGIGLLMSRADVIPENKKEYYLILKGDGVFQNVTESVSSGDKGDFYLFRKSFYGKSKWFGGQSYVDLMVPGVTEKFIELTMSGYEQRVGKEFGKTVPGVFTDEPNISARNGNVARWTPLLFSEFEKKWGYDLQNHLPSLFEQVGEWKRVRHNYQSVLLDLFIEYWSKPWYHYCEKNDLKWTGHYWEHGWPSTVHGPDNMAMYAWHQQPAIDMLFNSMDARPDQFGNIRAVKELSSIANQMGRVRTLSETYGAAGWELTFADMKRLGDWEFSLGVNFLNQHLAYMNMTGDRKHDFPQGICYQTPWWDEYKTLNDYFARLSVALSAGEQNNDILVLEPTTTTWMYNAPAGKSNKKLEKLADEFRHVLETLEDYGVEYDLGCENVIRDHASIQADQFIIGECQYSTVILPPVYENMDLKTFQLLQQYTANGGRVFAVKDNPQFVDGKLYNLSDLTTQPNWKRIHSIDVIVTDLVSDKFELVDAAQLHGNLFHMRRQLEDGQIIFLSNFDPQEEAIGAFRSIGKSVQRMDPFTGDIQAFPATLFDNQVEIEFAIKPAASVLLYVSNAAAEPVEKLVSLQGEIVPSTSATIQRQQPNMLTLDYMDLKCAGKEYQNIYFYTGGFEIWKAHGYPDNPWVSSSQFKQQLVQADTFKTGSGFEAIYPFYVQAGVDFSSLKAVVEQPKLWKVQVNGQPIEPIRDEWFIDKTFGVFSIGDFIKPGRNEIAVIMHPMSIFAEIEPVYILGEFDLQSQKQGWKIIADDAVQFGSWKKQGMPFYAYDVAYHKKADLKEGARYKVQLGNWNGTVASVSVNGSKAGIIAWQPYELDISSFVKTGENEIVVTVTGSLKNLLGPFHNNPRKGIVTPWSFKYAPKVQPAGVDYDQLDYGLFEDFKIYKMN